jgi:hypothetical protein
MRKFISCMALVGLIAGFGCNTSTDNTDDADVVVPNVAGAWAMTANTSFLFTLTLSQTEDIVGGFMERTNGVEPIDAISGTIDADGYLVFTRARVNQVYSGFLTSDATSRILEGTFTVPPATNQYPWRATMPK